METTIQNLVGYLRVNGKQENVLKIKDRIRKGIMENRETVISIIVPVYNTDGYIEQCLRSIFNQTYKNIEIICIDDGSDDNTGIILDRLAKEDKRLKVIHKKHEGVIEARNLALQMACGDYIGFVDSDDHICETMYQELLDAVCRSDSDIAICNYYIESEKLATIAQNNERVPVEAMNTRDFLVYIYERDKYKGVASYLWNRLFKREIIKDRNGKIHIYFEKESMGTDNATLVTEENIKKEDNTSWQIAEDIMFVARANMRSRRTVYVDKAMYYYRQREGSISHDLEKQYDTLFWIKTYEKVIELYRENSIEESIIDMLVRMYVYRCGKTLEFGRHKAKSGRQRQLVNKIKKNLPCYVKMNLEHLDRIKWLVDLMVLECTDDTGYVNNSGGV